MWIWAIAIVIIGLCLDLLVGEPPRKIHPVAWMGKLISVIDKRIPRNQKYIEIFAGITLCLIIILTFTVCFTAILAFIRNILGVIPWIVASSIVFKVMFAVRDMKEHVLPIINYVDKGDLDAARDALKAIVSRDVKNLDRRHILSASIESIAENTVDSILSPLMYLGISGVPLTITYRAVNTLDAMVGYKNRRYINVGFASAKLDDILNWLPARLCVIFMLLSSFILGKYKHYPITTIIRDASKHESPNSGLPISTMAWILNTKLEKIGYYSVGPSHLPNDTKYLFDALKVMETTWILFTIFICIPLYALFGIHIQIFLEDLIFNMILSVV